MVDLTRQPVSSNFLDKTGDELGQALATFLYENKLIPSYKGMTNRSPIKNQSKPFVKGLDWDALSQVMLEPDSSLTDAEKKAIEDWVKKRSR